MGAALTSVATAYAAASRGRFDELAPLLAEDIDWRGLPDEDGEVPSCRGRATAVEVMRRGAGLAAGRVSVQEFVEHDNRVLARVIRHDPDGPDRMHFTLIEINPQGQIARMYAYASEEDARRVLARTSPMSAT